MTKRNKNVHEPMQCHMQSQLPRLHPPRYQVKVPHAQRHQLTYPLPPSLTPSSRNPSRIEYSLKEALVASVVDILFSSKMSGANLKFYQDFQASVASTLTSPSLLTTTKALFGLNLLPLLPFTHYILSISINHKNPQLHLHLLLTHCRPHRGNRRPCLGSLKTGSH